MGSSGAYLPLLITSLILYFLITTISPTAVKLDPWAYQCIADYGNYTSNSTYKSNLDAVLHKVSSTEIPYGFYNFSAGQEPDQAFLIALCRGDVVGVADCHACLNTVKSKLTDLCPTQMEAIGWADSCMLRYSSRNILGGLWEEDPFFNLAIGDDVTDADHFANVVGNLLRTLPSKTAGGNSRLKFATGEASLGSSHSVYGLTQCTPDLPQTDCLGCLYWAMYYIMHPDTWKTGARVLLPSCCVMYESKRFYLSSSPTLAAPSSPAGKNDSSSRFVQTTRKKLASAKMIVTVAISVTLVAFLLSAAGISFLKTIKRLRRRPDFATDIEISRDDFTTAESLLYDLNVLQAATNNFSDANKLGEGGFGGVYRGTLRNGQEIAVKRLSQGSSQGAPEFKNEVLLVAKLQHRNLVRLLGFCLAGDEKLLVYEFVPNKSLDYLLFDPEKQAELDWTRRYKIIQGIARGILYLHEDSRLRIIHRDIKPSNILLDSDMSPKISDFGLAKILGIDQASGSTSRVFGTFGYMAPEYAFNGEFSESSDVYSFGVMVLEIITGQKVNNFRQSDYSEDHLTDYAWKKWKDDEPLEVMDSALKEGSYPKGEVIRCVHLGLLCVQEDVNARPSMSTIVTTLRCHSVSLPQPRNPAFYVRNRMDMYGDSRSVPSSVNSVSITGVYPR